MQIHFKGTQYELPANVTALARKKIEGLGKYLGRSSEQARVYADFGKESAAHQNGRIWRVDLTCDADGNRFYAKAVEESIEKALDVSVNDLGRELKRYRKRQLSLMRKGGSIIKSLVRGTN